MPLDIFLYATEQKKVFARGLLFELQQAILPDTRTYLATHSPDGASLKLPTSQKTLDDIFPSRRHRLVLVVFAADAEPTSDDYFPVQEFLERNRGACIVMVRSNSELEYRTRVYSLRHDPGLGTLIDLNVMHERVRDVLVLLLALDEGYDPERLGQYFHVDSFTPLPYAEPEWARVQRLRYEASKRLAESAPLPRASLSPPGDSSRGSRIIGARVLPVFIILALTGAIAVALLR